MGYGSSGGAYGSSGTYDPGEYIEEICSYNEATATTYGPGCAGAYEEVFACLASLDCSALLGWQDGDAFAPEACGAVFRDATELCPEGFPFCRTLDFSFGAGGCERGASNCADGNTYAVRCSEPGATQSCECERNGEVVQTVSVSGDLDCGDDELYDELNDACGFPPGVF